MAEVIRESAREEPDPDWALKEAKRHFTFVFPSMDLMKVIASGASISP